MIAETASGAILEALQQLSEWTGACDGPSGQPPADVAQAFEQALAGQTGNAEDISAADASTTLDSLEPNLAPGPAERMPTQLESAGAQVASPQHSQDVDAKPADADMHELGRLLGDLARPESSIAPAEVFRAQYLIGMLKTDVQAGLKSSQGASESLESLLRQQG